MTRRHSSKETVSEKKKEDWMNSKWRPMMGWMYMGVCIFDFVLAPILWTGIQAYFRGGITTQWQPLTLQGGGLFHVAMGAVIGINAYGRTQEKLTGAHEGGIVPAGQQMGTSYIPPGGQMGSMNNNMPGGFGGFNNGNTTTAATGFSGGGAAFGAPATGGFGAAPSNGFGAPSAGGFGSPTPQTAPGSFGGSGFGSTPPTVPPPVVSAPGTITVTAGFAGKKAPAPQDTPIL